MTVNHFVHHVPCYTIQRNHYGSAGSPLWLVLRKISVVAPALHNLLFNAEVSSNKAAERAPSTARMRSQQRPNGHTSQRGNLLVPCVTCTTDMCSNAIVVRFYSRYLTLQYSMFYSIYSHTYFTAKFQDIIRCKMAWYKNYTLI